MKKLLILFFLILPSCVFSAPGFWQITSSNYGATPSDAATSVCNSAGIYCQNFSLSSYLYDPSRTDLQTVYLYRPSGSLWSTETAQFMACQDGFLCSDYNYEAGATVCPDGFYSDSANAIGYPNTCDRPSLKVCGDGGFQLESGFCPISLPVCTDNDSCLIYAQSQLDCSGATDTNFTYIDQDNFSYSCTTDGQESAGLFGCNTEFCGGVTHVESSTDTNTDTGTTTNSGTDSITNTDNGTTTDSGTGSTTNTDTSSTTNTDAGTTADTGTGSTSNTGTPTAPSSGGSSGSGPCDPTQPDYMDCITASPGIFPAHTQSSVSSFDEANQIFKSRLDASPIVQSFSSMVGVMSVDSSACPSFSIDFPSPINKTVSTEIHCDLMNTISPLISVVMIIVYTFIGFRIFASA